MIQAIDNWVLDLLRYIQHDVIRSIFLGISFFGEYLVLSTGLLLALVFIKRHRMTAAKALIAVNLAATIGEFILKGMIKRPRPTLEGVFIMVSHSVYSFPSGHSAQSFACAYVLANYLPKYRAVIYLSASMIVFSRLYLQVHYFTDVLGGIVLGLLSGWIVTCIFSKKYKAVA